jgi:hypothetical protein
VVSFPSVVFSVVIDRFNDERLRRKEQALCAAYLSLKNRELQLIISGVFLLIYAAHQLWGLEWIKYLQDTQLLFTLSILSFLGGYFVYRSSLFLHAQFGETFKSLFDTHRNKVSVEGIIDEIASKTEDSTYKVKSSKEKYKIAWSWLHNYKVRIGDRVISPIGDQAKSEQGLISKIINFKLR